MNKDREEEKADRDDALFKCPRYAKDEEESEKVVLIAFGPHVRWFGKHCAPLSLSDNPIFASEGHQRTFIIGKNHKACHDKPFTIITTRKITSVCVPSLNFKTVMPTPKAMSSDVDPKYEYCGRD